jgi:hypothetical protein
METYEWTSQHDDAGERYYYNVINTTKESSRKRTIQGTKVESQWNRCIFQNRFLSSQNAKNKATMLLPCNVLRQVVAFASYTAARIIGLSGTTCRWLSVGRGVRVQGENLSKIQKEHLLGMQRMVQDCLYFRSFVTKSSIKLCQRRNKNDFCCYFNSRSLWRSW